MVLQANGSSEGKSPQEVYAAHCDALGCKKNSYLLKALPAPPNSFGSLVTLDLSLNFVGRVGLRAVLAVVCLAHNLERLCLADNWLDNQMVRELVGAIGDLPKLHYLDLSRNPISHTGGRILSDLVHRCPGIYSVQLGGTLINPALVRIIQRKAENNRIQAGAAEVEHPISFPRADAHGTAASPAPQYQLPLPLVQPPITLKTPLKHSTPAGPSGAKRQFPSLLSKAAADLAPSPPKQVQATQVPSEPSKAGEVVPVPEDVKEEKGRRRGGAETEEEQETEVASPVVLSPLIPLNTVFEVVEDDPLAGDFVGLAVLHAVAKETAPGAITARLPSPTRPAVTPPLPVPCQAELHDSVAPHATATNHWYAMRLVWLLVQKEKQSGNDNWGGLTSVVALIQKKR